MATKKAIVQHVQGVTFIGKGDSNHWITLDGPAQFGGSDAGTRPKELLLIALGGCTGSDVASILIKKKVPFTKYYMNLEAEVSEEHPQVYIKIHLEYVFEGKGVKKEDVERAIDLSLTKYCSVTAMLKKAIDITHSYRIVEVN
jgi:putative redox protein